MEQITFWEAAVPAIDLCGELKKDILEKSQHMAKTMLVKDDEINVEDMPHKSRCLMLREMVALFKALVRLPPCGDTLLKTLEKLQRMMVEMDSVSKYAMFEDAIKSWRASDIELTHKLKDAMEACGREALPETLLQALIALWTSVCSALSCPEQDEFLRDEGANVFQTLEMVSLLLDDQTPGFSHKYGKIAEYYEAAWRAKSLTKDLCRLLDGDAEQATESAKDKACQESLRVKQRVEMLTGDVTNSELAKQFGVFSKVEQIIAATKVAIQTMGKQIRDKISTDMAETIGSLKGKMQSVEKLDEWKGKLESCEDLEEIRAFWRDAFAGHAPHEWLALSASIEDQVTSFINKTNEYDLPKDDLTEKGAENLVKEARSIFCIHSILEVLDDKTLAGNKVAVRKRLRHVQADLKTYQLRPGDLMNEAVREAFKKGLAMKD